MKWDKRFLELAKLVSSWSKDPSTQVGAVITRDKKVVGLGYNGFPAGIQDDERLHHRDFKYELIIHAEMNALLNANSSVDGCTLYTHPMSPCLTCMKMVIQAGIKRIVYPEASAMINIRWGEQLERARQMALEAGVQMVKL